MGRRPAPGGHPVRRMLGASWRSLTSRGRTLIAAGLLCIAAGEVIGVRDLLRVGVLLIALPLAAWAIVARSRYRMRLDRTLTPKRVEAGSPARIVLRLENVSRLPSDTLLMEDTLPYALGGRPRFVVSRVEAGGVREATYTVRSQSRGRHLIGPLTVRIGDPFGCVELTRSFSSHATLTVSPKIVPLPSVVFGGDGVRGGEGRTSLAAVTGEADIATREHRHGDDMRKVHWRSTAKRGQLMVRRDEQPRQNRATLLLDTRASGHRGEGPTASLEWAVSACASVAVWLCRRGYSTQLITTAGTVSGGTIPTIAETAILDTLALVGLSDETGLDTFGRRDAQETGLLIAITTLAGTHDLRSLARLPETSRTAIAIVLNGATWGTRGQDEQHGHPRHRDLAALGWRVVPATSENTIDALWPLAGRAETAAGVE